MTLHYVSLPHATFGLVERDGVIVRAAPIARWCVGRPAADALAYWRRRGATTVAMADPWEGEQDAVRE